MRERRAGHDSARGRRAEPGNGVRTAATSGRGDSGPVVLDPAGLGLSAWRRVLEGAAVGLDVRTRPAVEASARAVRELVERGTAVYGVNTGFGKLAQTRIDAGDLATLQLRLIRSHATGVGEALPPEIVRLILALKITSLARGASGVRWPILELLVALLERNCLPVIPSQGSVGASGDLAPLAHMALVLVGEGEAVVEGERLPGAEALARVGLQPVVLGPKEGLALVNGTQVSTALALAGLFRAEDAFRATLVSGALSVDAARGSVVPFDARIHDLRGHRGQQDVARALRGLLEGSGILASHADCEKVQDAYCLRCQPQVMGAVLDLLRQAAGTLEVEARAVTDNPLIISGPEGKQGARGNAAAGSMPPLALSGGNFHAEPVAFAADQVAMAVCEMGSISERRIALLTDPATSGLPAFLSPEPGLNSGFMMAHVTAAALVAENRRDAVPASVDSIPTSANQEDHVSMATHGARRLGRMVDNLERIIAIELLCAVQGLDFHRPLSSSPPLEEIRRLVRTRVEEWREDRFLAPDVEEAVGLLSSPDFRDRAARLPGLDTGSDA